MSAVAILSEMLELLRTQTENLIRGDHQAMTQATLRHEQLLAELEQAPIDGTPAEIRALYDEIGREKTKLQSLLESESKRADFMLRLYLGGGERKNPGYPGQGRSAGARMLNRRT